MTEKDYLITHEIAQDLYNKGFVELPVMIQMLQQIAGYRETANWLIAFTRGKVEINQYEDKRN